MDLVYEYIWYALGGAGLAGFLLAWIVRGLMLAGRRRRATVERDVAITELEQVRSELDSLYAAQRKQKEAAPAAEQAMAASEERLARMSRELEAAKTELDVLRTSREGAAGPVQEKDSETLSALQSRNDYLEERVGELENRLHEMAESVPAPAAVPEAEAAAPEEGKLEWQVGYLKGRVAALEEKLLEASQNEAASEKPAPDNSLEEDLARLRWRNRYLEGRLAYYEEAPEASGASADNKPEADEVSPSPEIAPDISADADSEPETAPAPENASEEDEHPSEKMLRALDSSNKAKIDAPGVKQPAVQQEAPAALDLPDGKPDDLTLITGIGPRIQTILNDLGTWHFSQIAGWTSENEAWVDAQLNFAGRVGREGWVRQARELMTANEKAAAGS